MVQDPPAVNQPEIAEIVGRDPERTPMQWDSSPNAGFAEEGVRTWLPVSDDYRARNVSAQESDPGSVLTFFRAVTALRRSAPAFVAGSYRSLEAGEDDVFAYERSASGADRFAIALNFGGEVRVVDLSAAGTAGHVAISTNMSRTGAVDLSAVRLAGNEGVVIRIVPD
jgi:alpha-glucosidase